jgi:hypothetical protein
MLQAARCDIHGAKNSDRCHRREAAAPGCPGQPPADNWPIAQLIRPSNKDIKNSLCLVRDMPSPQLNRLFYMCFSWFAHRASTTTPIETGHQIDKIRSFYNESNMKLK